MVEILIAILIVLLVFIMVRLAFDFRKWLQNHISRLVAESVREAEKRSHERFKVAYLALQTEVERKIFDLFKQNIYQFEKNTIAKSEDILQTKQETRVGDGEFWKDKKRLEQLRESIALGNHDDYREIKLLADLAPLDAWREVDEAIAVLEEKGQHRAALGNAEH